MNTVWTLIKSTPLFATKYTTKHPILAVSCTIELMMSSIRGARPHARKPHARKLKQRNI